MFLKNNELIVLRNIDKNIKLKNNDQIFKIYIYIKMFLSCLVGQTE